MHNLTTQIAFNFRRLVKRNWRAILTTLFFPLFFYFFYTRIFTFPMSIEQERIWRIDYLVSMATFGVMMTAIATLAVVLAQDHKQKVDLFVDLSQSSRMQYYIAVTVAYLPLYVILFVALSGLAIFLNQVALSLGQWLILAVSMVVGGVLFSLIGILLSFVGNPAIVNVLCNLVSFPLAIMGGLWFPLYIMPQLIQDIAQFLPTHQLTQLTRDLIHKGHFHFNYAFGLLIWIVALLILIRFLTFDSRRWAHAV